MFSFFKKNKYKAEVPDWASFFEGNEYNEFIQAIDCYFTKRKITYELGDGMLTTHASDFGFNSFGLMNVAQMCKQQRPGQYKSVVEDHFDGMKRAHLFETEFNLIVHDFEKVKKYLGVRLYPVDYVNQVGRENVVGKSFTEEIFAMLIFDLPNSVINVKPDQTQPWKKEFDELFDIGLHNIWDVYPMNASQEKLGDDHVWFVYADHFYTPNVVFDLENKKEFKGSFGSLMSIPNRHAVLIYPIENFNAVKIINHLLPVVVGMYEEGPGSISSNLYWHTDDQIVKIHYEMDEKGFKIFPPQAFLDMLEALPDV